MENTRIVDVSYAKDGLWLKLNAPIPFKWKKIEDRYFLSYSMEKRTFSIEDIQAKHPSAYTPWTKEDDDRLEVLFSEGQPVKEISRELGRMKGAIYSRINKLGLREIYR